MKKLALGLLLTFPLFAQPQQRLAPDCAIGQAFAGTGNSANYDNRAQQSVNAATPCTIWALVWYAQSAVTSLTINIEGAADSNGTPGSFSSLSSATTFPSGILKYPASSSSTAYSPWMRITVSAVGASGAIYAVMYGWREDQASINGGGSGSGCPGTDVTPCVVDGPTSSGSAPTTPPVYTAGLDGNGNLIAPTFPSLNSEVALTSSGLTQILAGSSGKSLRIEHLSISFASSVNFQLEYGTGSNCATGTTAVTGTYQGVVSIALDFDSGPLTIPAGDSLCANLGSSVTGGGLAVYALF